MNPTTDAVAEDLADYLQDPLRISTPVKKRSSSAVSASAQRERKILQQPGFVLHARPYKETSLIVDVLTRDFGRIALVAKGAKRPHSQLRSVLQTFQPLNLSWMGKTELKTLTSADWVGGMLPLEKSALVCGFYLNELIIKFLLKDEPHPALFDQYVATINQLAHGESAPVVLRQFELVLLRQSGLLGDIHLCTEQRAPVQPELHYVLDPQAGTRPARPGDHFPVLSGACLLAMAEGDYSLPETQFQSKMLMRFLLSHHLHGAVLSTRQLLIDLQNL